MADTQTLAIFEYGAMVLDVTRITRTSRRAASRAPSRRPRRRFGDGFPTLLPSASLTSGHSLVEPGAKSRSRNYQLSHLQTERDGLFASASLARPKTWSVRAANIKSRSFAA